MTELPESFEEVRYGGPSADAEDSGKSEAQKKAEERDRKKAEVRKRLEEAGSKKRAKKGFLTPERKKKLRKLLMMKAAEDLKQQQLKREHERQAALGSKIPALPDLESLNDHAKLESIYQDMFEKVKQLEEEKFDINAAVAAKDSEINELTIAVNDLRGKFVKPALKKVSKYDNKFKKFNEVKGGAEKQDFRPQLKVVKKENILDELVQKKAKSDKPEWSNKNKGEKPKTDEKTDEEEKEDKEEKTEEEPAPAAAEEAAPEEEEEEEEEGEEEEEE